MKQAQILIPLALAAAGSLVCLIALSDDASNALVGLVTAGVASSIFVASIVVARVCRGNKRRFKIRTIEFWLSALRHWAAQNEDVIGEDSLISWATDQLLVAQQRYAVAVSCIAFGRDDRGELRVLLHERDFTGFEEKVLLWPGGRFRGHRSKTLQAELEEQVRRDTGCKIELVSPRSPNANFCSRVPTYTADDSGHQNELYQPPLFVMQQNKPQTHRVPGHVDVIFLARVLRDQYPSGSGRWASVKELDEHPPPESRLWPDTRDCILLAAKIFEEAYPRDEQGVTA